MGREESGFTLVEVLFATAILSLVLAGIASAYVQDARVNRSDELAADLVILSGSISNVLSTPACDQALAGKPLDLTRFPIPLESLSLPGGSVAQVGSPPYGLQVTALEVDKVLAFDIQVQGFEHQHLVQIHLHAKKKGLGAPFPGVNDFDKYFVTSVWQDVRTLRITRCF